MKNRKHYPGATPEDRIAAAARTIQLEHEPNSMVPDVADFRDALRPYVHQELILARIDEARHITGSVLTERMKFLAAELKKWESNIPLEDRS